MAKISEQIIIVKVSKLVKDYDKDVSIIGEDFIKGIEAVSGELLQDPSCIIEVDLGLPEKD